jgi:hypothetical protein
MGILLMSVGSFSNRKRLHFCIQNIYMQHDAAIMKYLTLTFLALMQAVVSCGQSDTTDISKEDTTNSHWVLIYLDQYLASVKDSAEATHCYYALFTGKFNHHNMGAIGSKKHPVHYPVSDTILVTNKKLLNGKYYATHKNGNIQFELIAKEGVFQQYREYYKSGQIKNEIFYSSACGAPVRTCIIQYDKSGNVKYEGYNRVP